MPRLPAVYALWDPRCGPVTFEEFGDGDPDDVRLIPSPSGVRYIGQTVGLLRPRLNGHIGLARRGSGTYSARWLRALLALRLRPVIVEVDATFRGGNREPPKKTHLDVLERYWVSAYRKLGARLTNGNSGGGFGHRPVECPAMRRRMADPDFRAKMAEGKPPWSAWHKSAEARASEKAAAAERRQRSADEAGRRKAAAAEALAERQRRRAIAAEAVARRRFQKLVRTFEGRAQALAEFAAGGRA